MIQDHDDARAPELRDILNDCMKEKGIAEHEMAELCNCSYQTIRNIQSGKEISARLANRIII